jgi:hypothetical protein
MIWGTVQTASTTLPLTAFGTINWAIQTTTGSSFTVTVPGFYVPGFSVRLLSPQDYVRHHRMDTSQDHYGGNSKEFWMRLQDDNSLVRAPIVSGSKLPIMVARFVPSSCGCSNTTDSFLSSFHSDISVFDLQNQNISTTQKHLLLNHCRLGHLSFQHLQSRYRHSLMTHGSFIEGEQVPQPCLRHKTPGISSCTIPGCKACYLSKAKRRRIPGKRTTLDLLSAGALKRDDIMPGARISMDHYHSSVRGRLEYTRGHE